MFLLLLSILIASTNATALLNVGNGKTGKSAKQSLLQNGNGDAQVIAYQACNQPPVSELNREDCKDRSFSRPGKIIKMNKKSEPCHTCPVGMYDVNALVEDTADFDSTNVCVQTPTDCIQPTRVPNTNSMKFYCGGEFGNCGLAPQQRVTKSRAYYRDVDPMGNQIMKQQWIYLETYEVTQGGAKFMHITTPEAAAQIVNDQLIKASGALNDANVQRFGTQGKQNSYALRALGSVSLYPIRSNLDGDALADKAADLQDDAAKNWAVKKRPNKDDYKNLATILVTLPQGTILEADTMYEYSLVHNGNIQAGPGIQITQVDIGDRAEVGSSAEVEVKSGRAEVELKQKMQFMGFTVFLVVSVIFIIHNCRVSKSHEMYEKLPEEI